MTTVTNNTNQPRITFDRKQTPVGVLINGVRCGEIRRGSKGRFYILSIQGIYWAGLPYKERPSLRGGCAAVGRKTLTECKALAIRTIQNNYATLKLVIPTVRCSKCDVPTKFTGTKLCDSCWESSRRSIPVRGDTPLETAANAIREVVVKYLVIYKLETIEGQTFKFGFFNATTAFDAKLAAAKAWDMPLIAQTRMICWHPDNIKDGWSYNL